ncbi:pyridoxamine 5'-phosphate oxidase family protein [Micromonosporaceae bacterium Da 78-11]
MSVRLSPAVEAFLAENATCTLTTIRADGSPHVAPVRFTWDAGSGVVRVMTASTRHKVQNLRAHPSSRAAVCQVSGPRWITMEGVARVSDDPLRVAEGARRYAQRYWAAPPNVPGLVVIHIEVDRVMGIY